MTTLCEVLNRPLRGAHPEEMTALCAKADLLMAGVAVDDYAKVVVEYDASLVHEASPRAAGKRATEIVRPAPVQAAERVPPKSWPGTWRSQSYNQGSNLLRRQCRLRSCTVTCLRSNKPPRSVPGGPGTGTRWTAQKSPTELAQNAQWMAAAPRLGAKLDAGPHSTCALRKGNDGDMCEQSLVIHPFHPFCCKYGVGSLSKQGAMRSLSSVTG